MIEADRLIEPVATVEDEGVDRAIRPKMLADYTGQAHVKAQMKIFIPAEKSVVSHLITCLFLVLRV